MALSGEHDITIDSKNRCLIPAAIRKQLPEAEVMEFCINRGTEHCLNIYPIDVWNQELSKLDDLDEFDDEAMTFKRLFLNGHTIVELDKTDRLLIPKKLADWAGLKKDVLIIGMGKTMELWDATIHDEYIKSNAKDYKALAKKVMSKKKENVG